MFASKHDQFTWRRQGGFSLVELMVGIVISMLVSLAAMSVAQFFLQSQRHSTGVGSATANAVSALQAVKHEASQAGLGFSIGGLMPCTSMNLSLGNKVVSDGAAFLPISVTRTNVATSTLTLAYGTALEAATPGFTRNDQTSADTAFELISFLPAAVGQAVMIAPPVGVNSPCTVRTVTGVLEPAGPLGQRLQFEGNDAGFHNQVAFGAVTSYPDTSQVFLLGRLRQTVFGLSANNDLTLSRPLENGNPRVVLARGIVGFAVQYGVTDGVNQSLLEGWQPATGEWAAPSALQISRVHALNVGIVARSSQRQKPAADGTCNATTEQPMLLGQPLTLGGDWQCFKYRSLSAVVPLRNMVLGSST